MATVRTSRYYQNFSAPNENSPEDNNIAMPQEEETAVVAEIQPAQNPPPDESFATEDSSGAISVQVLTARGTRPVPDSTVIVYKSSDTENGPFSFGLTDADGRTPIISAPAPRKSDAQSPSDTLPFSDYNILVENPKYYTAEINNVQVFGDELTILTIELIPLPELVNEINTTKTTTIPKQNL
ncbi:MAG: hypothetical protein IKU87_02000 [Clostridia bacterium]|nr:hypothetical protein [Clostridia bacterium]